MLSEYQAILDPQTRAELSSYQREFSGKITVSGATNSNRRWELDHDSETLNIEGQRICWDLIRVGLVTSNASLLSAGMSAITWSLSPMVMGDGDWPLLRAGDTGNNTHPRMVFLSAACRSVYLLEESKNPLVTPAWLTNTKSQLIKSAKYLLAGQDYKDFIATKNTMNQRLSAGIVFRITGMWSNDKSLLNAADFIFLDATTRMTKDGVLPEAYGYDWSYQSLSLELIAFYLNTFATPSVRVKTMLTTATAKWCSSIDDKGIVNAVGSRTVAKSYKNSAVPHGPNIDQYAQRARYIARLYPVTTTKDILPKLGVVLQAKAKLLAFSGPDFSHIGE